MKALIVEDEPVAARSLQRLLAAAAPDMDASAVVGSVAAAVDWLRTRPPPDLLLLDVQLSDGLSFDIFDAVSPDAPVIFTTAHDEYALRAFEVFGIDYLLKPIDPVRLAAALAKLEHVRRPAPAFELARAYRDAAKNHKQRFLVHSGTSLVSVDAGQIAYFAKELVVRLVTTEGRGFALSQSLDELHAALDPAVFFRLNRQVLAHIQAVGRAQRLAKGKLEVDLVPPLAQPVVVSQERAAAFRQWLDR